jgi:hypothetical protein
VDPPVGLLDNDKKKRKRKDSSFSELPPEKVLQVIPESALNNAKALIETELESLMESQTRPLLQEGTNVEHAKELLLAETIKAIEAGKSSSVFTGDGWVPATRETELQSLALEFDTLQEATSALRKKNDKAESKLAVLTGGLVKRAETIHAELLQTYGEIQNATIEHVVYAQLQSQEELGAVKRMDQLRAGIARLQQDEAQLYEVYQDLMAKRQAPIAAEVQVE